MEVARPSLIIYIMRVVEPQNEVDTIVKVIVNEKPVVNNDIKATTPNVFVPNRIEHLIELENFEMINKKILI